MRHVRPLCAWQQIKKPAVGSAGPLCTPEGSAYMSVLCYVTDTLARSQRDNFCMCKGRLRTLFFAACFGVSLCVFAKGRLCYIASCTCVSAELLAHCVCSSHTALAGIMPTTTPIVRALKRSERAHPRPRTRTFTCLSNCAANSVQLPHNMANIYIHR